MDFITSPIYLSEFSLCLSQLSEETFAMSLGRITRRFSAFFSPAGFVKLQTSSKDNSLVDNHDFVVCDRVGWSMCGAVRV